MRSCYYDRLDGGVRIAIADLCDYHGRGMIITRVNVPTDFRGKGHGSALLQRILDDADNEGISLFLEIGATGGMTHEQLRSWYMRHGFREWNGMYRRVPIGAGS